MKRTFAIALFLILAAGGFAFSSDYDLPEPSLSVEPQKEAAIYQATDLWLPNFNEVIYYLWNFNDVYPPEAAAAGSEFLPIASLAAAASPDAPIPGSIRNNKYFIESVRLTNMAQEAFEEGDYDLSTQYSMDAVRYAEMSDEYVAIQLKIKECNDAILVAANRVTWAGSNAVKAQDRYPDQYTAAQAALADAQNYRKQESYDDSIYSAHQVINILANITEAPPPAPPQQQAKPVETPKIAEEPGPAPLPAQYTVRPWSVSKDCFWNIAGRPWAYGDPMQWKLLYSANKAKLPEPGNPDLIHPGMVIDIPSANGEARSGMWDASKTYKPIK